MEEAIFSFGLWCNGNTTDSGPVFLGSNPSSPTALNICLSQADVFLFSEIKKVRLRKRNAPFPVQLFAILHSVSAFGLSCTLAVYGSSTPFKVLFNFLQEILHLLFHLVTLFSLVSTLSFYLKSMFCNTNIMPFVRIGSSFERKLKGNAHFLICIKKANDAVLCE